MEMTERNEKERERESVCLELTFKNHSKKVVFITKG